MDESNREQFREGILLFNRGEYYDCHDTLEEIWLQESSDEQPFLQGVIQSAVAFHHYQQNKLGAARSMFRLAIEKLEAYPDRYQGIELGALLKELRSWKEGLERALSARSPEAIPRLYPTIRFSNEV